MSQFFAALFMLEHPT